MLHLHAFITCEIFEHYSKNKEIFKIEKPKKKEIRDKVQKLQKRSMP